jgi:hypothetical protein
VECPPHYNPITVFCKASEKWREAEESVGVLGEVSSGVARICELPEAQKEFQGGWWFGKVQDIKFW